MPERFFVVGGQRCGTTWLADLLEEHPEIALAQPRRPEPKFFLDPSAPDRVGEYEATFFPGAAASAPVQGEKSTTYLETPAAAPRIRTAYPGARIVVVVREPVARAVSNYHFTCGHGLEERPVDVALDPDAPVPPHDRARFSASPYAYLARGLYAELLAPWCEAFPPGQVGVFVFEELVADPASVAQVYGLVGADPTFEPTGGGAVVNRSEPGAQPSPATLERLRSFYDEPNRRLEALLGREIPAWSS